MGSKNIYVLPTDKPSSIGYDGVKKLHLTNMFIDDYQNIYITSDEEIKEGDWWLNLKTNDVDKCTHKSEVLLYNSEKYEYIKKIILTTDQDLINDGVQSIDDDFLEWFVKNPSCESVEVIRNSDYEMLYKVGASRYKIIIPKEEPKQELERGIDIIHVGKRNQETLEEAFVRFMETNYSGQLTNGFVLGAMKFASKWQAERMYSEEEVHKILGSYSVNKEVFSYKHTYDMWFEQFKK